MQVHRTKVLDMHCRCGPRNKGDRNSLISSGIWEKQPGQEDLEARDSYQEGFKRLGDGSRIKNLKDKLREMLGEVTETTGTHGEENEELPLEDIELPTPPWLWD